MRTRLIAGDRVLQTLIVLLLSLKIGASMGVSRRLWAWAALPLLVGLPFGLLDPDPALGLARVALLGCAWGLALSLVQISRWNARLRPGVAAVVAVLAMEGGLITLTGLGHFAPGASMDGALMVLGAGLACAMAGLVTGTTREAAAQSGRVRLGAALCAIGVGVTWYAEAERVASAAAVGLGHESQANLSAVAGWSLLLLAVTAAPPVLAGLHGRWVRRWGPAMAGGAALALPATALALGAGLQSTCEDYGQGGPDWCGAAQGVPACASAPEIFVDEADGGRYLDEPVPLAALRRSWGVRLTGVEACFRAFPDARPQPYRVGLLFEEGGVVSSVKTAPLWQAGEPERALASCVDRVFQVEDVPGAACHELDGMVISFYGGAVGEAAE
ncbi:MAG: hypothetical protein H6741_19615 [Alphaproteobacteria bacterium]|nr:hypothetical protein [Alphaproteobacteria bacterium]